MVKVYIASPYTLGNQAENVRRQMDAANELINLGFNPYVPLLWHFQHMVHPQDYQTWLNIDMEWVTVCDCLLRLEGESDGADNEVMFAETLNIPIFYSIKELHEYYK